MPRSEIVNNRLLWFVAAIWATPCALFVGDFPSAVQEQAGLGAFISNVLIALYSQKSIVFGIPFTAMLGPISGLQPFGLEGVVLSDVFLLIACISVAASILLSNSSLRFGDSGSYILVALILCCLSWAASLDIRIAARGFANIVVLTIVYFVTVATVTSERMGGLLLRAWMIAACYGAIITVVAYTRATPLILGAESIGGQQFAVDMLSLGYLYRATHYYAGFFFVIGTAGVVFLIHVYRGKTALCKIGGLAGLVFTLGVLFLMNTKSAMAAFIVLAAIETCRSLAFDKAGIKLGRTGLVVLALLIASLVGFYASGLFFEEQQFEIAIDRMSDTESFEIRIAIFKGAMEELFGKPVTLFAGLGPDVTVRMAESGHSLIDSLLTNPNSGIMEGALDSTYVTVFLEYGILFGLWMLLFCGKTLSLLYREMRKREASLLPSLLIAIVLWWMIVASTQRVGTSKPTWLIVQVMALAYSLYSVRNASKGYPIGGKF